MAGLLGEIFSAGNVAKRKLTDLLGNPVLSAQQFVGNLNDRARNLNEMTAAAAREGMDYGPATQRLAGLMADAYSPMGLTVFHGSPAKFNKFDRTKIGSGEGAQAYGYGHYVAESPGVAKDYQSRLSELPFPSGDERNAVVRLIESKGKSGEDQAKKYLAPKYGDDNATKMIQEAKEAAEKGRGSFYEIDLPDEQISKMLDYDKPLSKQAPEVKKALENIGFKVDEKKLGEYEDALLNQLLNDVPATPLPKRPMDWTGEQIMREIERNPSRYFSSVMEGRELTGAMIDPRVGASELMKRQGIPGIRYLDQGSRGTGEGTSNFVVFPGNEDLLTILKRNGGLLD